MGTDPCSACGQVPTAAARYCPRCGAALPSADRPSPLPANASVPSAGDTGTPWSSSSGGDADVTPPPDPSAVDRPTTAPARASAARRLLPLAGVAAALLLTLGTAAMVTGPWDEPSSQDVDGEVVLPGRATASDTAPGEAGAAAPDADASDDAAAAPAGCEPAGCDRWRSSQPEGHTIVTDGRVFHLGGGAIEAIDDAGEVVAEAETAITGRSPGGLLPLDGPHDDLLVAVGDRRLEVRGRDDLAVRWSLDVRDASLANVSHNGDVLVVIGAHGSPAAGSASEAGAATAGDPDPNGPVDPDGPSELDGPVDPDASSDPDVPVDPDADAAAGPRLEPPEDGTDDGLRGRRSRPVVSGFDVRTGERRWQRAGLPFSTEGVVALSSAQGTELTLLDPRDGEDLLRLAGRRYLGSSDDRIAIHDVADATVDLRAWPSLDTVGRVEVDPAATPRLVGGLLVIDHPVDGGGSAGDIEVVDPTGGQVLDRFDGPDVAVRAAPGGDGVIVLEPSDDRVRLRHLDRQWQVRWSSEVRFEMPADARLTAVRGPRGQIGVGVVLDGGRIDVGVLVDDRTGLPVIDDDAGIGDVAGTFGDLLVHRSSDATELRGAHGVVRFRGPVDLLHPSEPLLVRDGQDLVAVDEGLLRGP